MYFLRLCLILLLVINSACKKTQESTSKGKVFIEYKNGKYILKRNGKPFVIKGVAGYSNLEALKNAGGNTIRTWDTTNLDGILSEAQALNLAVVVGLPMPNISIEANFYQNPQKVQSQYQAYSKLINRYKNHPAVLFWCLGNELAFPQRLQFNAFYQSFNNLVEMIHREDPNHLVTTTVVNTQPRTILNIKLRTEVDFISVNIFGRLKYLAQDLKDLEWLWDGPFLITEWGIDGPWGDANQTVWGSYIENTSTKKAEQYLSIYQQYMPVDNPRFLGSLAFYWGQKQEYTPTWFSLFAENGAAAETVGTMQKIWTNQYPKINPPKIKYMLVDKKGAKDNILFTPNKSIAAQVFMEDRKLDGLTFSWEILPEDWHRVNDTFNDKKPKAINDLLIEQHENHYVFRTPKKEGPYRIYVKVYDQNGLFASANTPFYVVEK